MRLQRRQICREIFLWHKQTPALYAPPPGSLEAALIAGALIAPGKTPTVERDLPPQHTAPPLASLGPALLQQDNRQLKDYHEWQQAAADADRAFDAEVGEEDGLNQISQSPPLFSLGDGLGAVGDVTEMVGGASMAARASWRMFAPFSQTESSTWGNMMFEEMNRDVARGVVTTPEEYLQRLNALPDESGKRLNYTEVAEFADGVQKFSNAALNLSPLVLQVGADFAQGSNPELAHDLRGASGTLEGSLNIRQGVSQAYDLVQGSDWLGKMLSKSFGKPLVFLQGLVGVIDYLGGANRLVADPRIVPGASKYAWTERVGVATQAIGGAFLAGGAAVALFGGPPGVAVGAILLTAGLGFEGVGFIMQNWDWVADTTHKIFGKP